MNQIFVLPQNKFGLKHTCFAKSKKKKKKKNIRKCFIFVFVCLVGLGFILLSLNPYLNTVSVLFLAAVPLSLTV